MIRVLVADQIAEEGLAKLRSARDLAFDVKTGLKPTELAPVLGEYDGMVIRSGVQVTAESLAKAGKLRVIARAGVGVDNVDVPAATAAGILVINTPDANTISTAEHTVAMMLAAARHIPEAHASTRAGNWDRKTFVGRQLMGKTLGVVGLGRVGTVVAELAMSFGMTVLAFDPFLGGNTALEGRVRVVQSLDELLPQVDVLSLHAVLTDDTRNLIGAAQLKKMKRTAVLVNCARGGLIDEAALAGALNDGAIGGAAIDVYPQEPPKGSPLLSAKNIVLTPHLGASTEEAQLAVSTDAVDSLLDYLQRGVIRGAVNVGGLPASLSDRDRAYLDLTGRMGAILATWSGDGIDRITVTTHGGASLTGLGQTLGLAALAEVLAPHIEGRLNLVNAGAYAKQRGIELLHASHVSDREFQEVVTVRIDRRGAVHQVEGAVFLDGRPRVLAIDGYRMEMVPEGLLVLIFNDDRPGVIGVVGTLFGDHQINIADMFLSRREKTALMCLKIDGTVPESLLEQLRGSPAILSVRTVGLASLGR